MIEVWNHHHDELLEIARKPTATWLAFQNFLNRKEYQVKQAEKKCKSYLKIAKNELTAVPKVKERYWAGRRKKEHEKRKSVQEVCNIPPVSESLESPKKQYTLSELHKTGPPAASQDKNKDSEMQQTLTSQPVQYVQPIIQAYQPQQVVDDTTMQTTLEDDINADMATLEMLRGMSEVVRKRLRQRSERLASATTSELYLPSSGRLFM